MMLDFRVWLLITFVIILSKACTVSQIEWTRTMWHECRKNRPDWPGGIKTSCASSSLATRKWGGEYLTEGTHSSVWMTFSPHQSNFNSGIKGKPLSHIHCLTWEMTWESTSTTPWSQLFGWIRSSPRLVVSRSSFEWLFLDIFFSAYPALARSILENVQGFPTYEGHPTQTVYELSTYSFKEDICEVTLSGSSSPAGVTFNSTPYGTPIYVPKSQISETDQTAIVCDGSGEPLEHPNYGRSDGPVCRCLQHQDWS